jgi:tetratricopeptide (TPR) repeat protein
MPRPVLELRNGCALLFVLSFAVLGSACASSAKPRPTPARREVVQMEELRITAARGQDGYSFEVYDAKDLFARATELLNAQKCAEAVELYDRVAEEFQSSAYASPALYNGGLCLQALGDFKRSADRYALLRKRYPASDDYRDASFQLAEVLIQLERWDETIAAADEMLALQDLRAHERLEGMARRAQGLLGKQSLDEAERAARNALSFYRTRPADDRVPDDFFAAAANFVLAETFRERGQGMAFPEGLEAQKQVLVRRAELLLEAQREYFNTISLNNLDNYYWAAASGYRIGNMYDELWHAVMNAPVPAHLDKEGHGIYRQELAKLINPLIRHAIRYFELTSMFIERTGMRGAWADKTREDLVRVRALVLEQPVGPGGLQAEPAATGPSAKPPPPPKPRRPAASVTSTILEPAQPQPAPSAPSTQ